ncbi:MAG: RNA recognition motif domain-containing protein [Sandaracinaceae bacterium]
MGGLSWNTDEDTLRQTFETIGRVTEVKIITDRDTGRSRGFGFVDYAAGEDGKRAITEFDGSTLDGRSLHVTEARERAPRRAAY